MDDDIISIIKNLGSTLILFKSSERELGIYFINVELISHILQFAKVWSFPWVLVNRLLDKGYI